MVYDRGMTAGGLAKSIRRHVLYTGHVQGVGFRATVQYLSNGFSVSGSVRNLADGQVELIAEGSTAELDRFMTAIAMRMQRHIRDTTVTEHPANGEFSGFHITR